MSSNPADDFLNLIVERVTPTKFQVQVLLGKRLVHVDTVALLTAAAREKFVEQLKAKVVGIEPRAVDDLLIQRVAELAKDKPATEATPVAPEDEPWGEPLDGGNLLDEIAAFLSSYMVLPDSAANTMALWVLHTYLIDVSGGFTPYVWVSSPTRECGKSTLLELLSHLAHRGQMTGGITAAALYRRIDRDAPTMILDELDTRLKGDGGENLRGVLNTGFHITGRMTLCVGKGDGYEDKDFKTYCPKVLAGIGRIWDTVSSRSIPVQLRRASKGERQNLIKVRGDRIREICTPYRRKLLRFANDIRTAVMCIDAEVPDSLGARQSDIWRPLFAIADAVGGDWRKKAEAAVATLYADVPEESDNGLLLLEDLRALFAKNGTDRLSSEQIIDHLAGLEGRPWPEWRNEKPISKNGVADILKKFKITSRTIRMSDSTTPKGYFYSDFLDAFATYLPLSPETNATNATTLEKQALDACGVSKSETPHAKNETPQAPTGDTSTSASNPGKTSVVADVADEKGDGTEKSPPEDGARILKFPGVADADCPPQPSSPRADDIEEFG